MPAVWKSVRRWVALPRLRVHENLLNHRFQISSNALSVVCEDRRDATDVGGRGIAGDQMLNQVFADKRGHIGMIEDIVQSIGQILLRCLSHWERDTVKQGL